MSSEGRGPMLIVDASCLYEVVVDAERAEQVARATRPEILIRLPHISLTGRC
jgi:hypothetical protein